MPVKQKIREKYNLLSKKQKVIADYFLENKSSLCSKTLRQISIETKVTELTIINFCKKLNFNGFGEFKEEYDHDIKINNSQLKKVFRNDTKKVEYDALFKLFINHQINSHNNTLNNLNEKSIMETIELINKSKKIFIFCEGYSNFVGSYLKAMFDTLALETEIVNFTRFDLQFLMKFLSFTPQDLYFTISYPTYTSLIVKIGEYLFGNGFNVISFTDKPDSPLTKNSNITFYSHNDSITLYNSFHSSISIIEVIMTLLSKSREGKILHMNDSAEKIENFFAGFRPMVQDL